MNLSDNINMVHSIVAHSQGFGKLVRILRRSQQRTHG